VSSLKYEKPNKKNVFRQIWQDIGDSNNGLAIIFRESSTVHRLIPLEIGVGVLLGIIFGYIALEYVIMAVVEIILFTAETANSAVEEVNDLVTEEYNERVKRSKDIASGSVWIWHLMYIFCVFFFLVCHIVGFAWWQALIPG
jgi:diacylglycerol kinase